MLPLLLLPAAGVAAPSLEISGVCPGQVTVRISDATPSSRQQLLRGVGPGSIALPSGRCVGMDSGLEHPRPMGRVTVDVDGVVRVSGVVPASACGRSVVVIDSSTCERSTVELVPSEGECRAGGAGTVDDPYEVCDPASLQAVGDDLTGHYLQLSDIDMADFAFTQLGAPTDLFVMGGGFEGSYDGGGFAISELTVDGSGDDDLTPTGMFRQLEPGASVQSLTLTDLVVDGNNAVGGLAGVSYGDLTDITLENLTVTGHATVGGVTGRSEDTELSRLRVLSGTVYSSADGSIISSSVDTGAGGISGVMAGGSLVDSETHADVTWDPAGVSIQF